MEILNNLWLYGGAYFAALATASSFYAIFFFFWTRTGNRGDNIDLETKKIYLMPVYWILRLSLIMVIISKILEVIFVKKLLSGYGLEVGFFEIATSEAMLFIFTLLVILAGNSFLMYKKKINYAYAIPLAVVSYFFLFVELTTLYFRDLNFYVTKAGESGATKVIVYVAVLIVFYAVFRYFSNKIRSTK